MKFCFHYFEWIFYLGVITTTSNPIDFEEIGTPVVLTIEARDGGIPSRATDITVSIAITDLNDNPPTFLGTPYSTTVAENTATGTIVFTAIINDADTTTITLTIISGDTGMFIFDKFSLRLHTYPTLFGYDTIFKKIQHDILIVWQYV